MNKSVKIIIGVALIYAFLVIINYVFGISFIDIKSCNQDEINDLKNIFIIYNIVITPIFTYALFPKIKEIVEHYELKNNNKKE